MSDLNRDTTRADVFDRLALRIRAAARQEHVNSGSGAERHTVTGLAPLQVEHFSSDLVLTDGDPDFTVGDGLRTRIAAGTLALGDEVWVLREEQRWHAVDLAVAA